MEATCTTTNDPLTLAIPDGPAPGITPRKVATATLNFGGYGYTAGDLLTVWSGNGIITAATITVDSVDADGVITAISLTAVGDFTTDPPTPNAPQGGTGQLAIVDLTFTVTGGSALVISNNLLVATVNPPLWGQLFSITAGPGLTEGETVTFQDNGVTFATRTIQANGTATVNITSSTLGSVSQRNFTAIYNFDSSTLGPILLRVGKAIPACTIASAANPAVHGQSVTYTVTISAVSPAGGTPGGLVTFLDGETVLGTGSLSSSQATFTPDPLTVAVGAHCMRATYEGDAHFTAGGTPTGLSQQINRASSTTSRASSLNPANVGDTVTFSTAVNPVAPSSGTPTGTVTFMDGSTPLGTVALTAGAATLDVASLTAGSHSITVVYNGSVDFFTSTSSALTQVVN